MMGLRSLFPKKEIRYRADSDTVVNVIVPSKEKKRRTVAKKTCKEILSKNYYNIKGMPPMD